MLVHFGANHKALWRIGPALSSSKPVSVTVVARSFTAHSRVWTQKSVKLTWRRKSCRSWASVEHMPVSPPFGAVGRRCCWQTHGQTGFDLRAIAAKSLRRFRYCNYQVFRTTQATASSSCAPGDVFCSVLAVLVVPPFASPTKAMRDAGQQNLFLSPCGNPCKMQVAEQEPWMVSLYGCMRRSPTSGKLACGKAMSNMSRLPSGASTTGYSFCAPTCFNTRGFRTERGWRPELQHHSRRKRQCRAVIAFAAELERSDIHASAFCRSVRSARPADHQQTPALRKPARDHPKAHP